VLFKLFAFAEPLMYFRVCHGTPLTKIEKTHELLIRKSNISLLDTSTSKQLLQKLNSKKFNYSVVLAFLECSLAATAATFRIWSSGKKNPYLKFVPSHLLTLAIESHLVRFGLGASFTLNYNAHYRPHRRCCYYFASNKKMLFCFIWLD